MIAALPGTIPDLLRRGSPVVWRDPTFPHPTRSGVYWGQRKDGAHEMAGHLGRSCLQVEALDRPPDLDLTDATGRAHAARWVSTQPEEARWFAAAQVFTSGSRIAALEALLDAAIWQRDMTEAQIDELARIALILAGVQP